MEGDSQGSNDRNQGPVFIHNPTSYARGAGSAPRFQVRPDFIGPNLRYSETTPLASWLGGVCLG